MSKTRLIIKADEKIKPDIEISPFPLLDVFEDVRNNKIYPKFPLKECGLFAQTSRANEEAVAFLRLLPSAVDAEPESYTPESYLTDTARVAATPKAYQIPDETKLAAIAILQRHLKKDPELLFRIGLVTDHYGRKIWASAIRLFLGAGDIWALKQVYELIIPHIVGGEAKAQDQFKQQFPNCPWPFDPGMGEEVLYDDRNKEQVAQVAAQLQVIDAKITADPCTKGLATLEETKNAVADLCQIFAPKKDEVIQTGLHFPLAIQRKIHELYDTRLRARLNNQPNAWSWDQLAFFSREVIGSMEAALTSVDGQCAKAGLGNMDMEKGPDRRDGLFCRWPKGIPAKLAPLQGKLGRTVFVDPYDGYSCFLTAVAGSFDCYNKNVWAIGRPSHSCVRSALLENLWRTKAETYGSYYAAARREINTPS